MCSCGAPQSSSDITGLVVTRVVWRRVRRARGWEGRGLRGRCARVEHAATAEERAVCMECCSGAAPESRAATSRDDEAKLWGSATQPGAGCGVQCRAEGRALEPRDASRRFTHDGHNTPHQRPARWLPGLYVPWPRFESAAGRLSGALARSHGHVPPHTAPRRCRAAETASAARAAPSYPTPVAYRLPPALLTNCTPQPVPGCVAEPSAREEAVLPTTAGVSYIRSPPSKAQLSPR